MSEAVEQPDLSKLPSQYQQVLSELRSEDVAIVAKHLPHYNAYKEFANLVELGIDVATRRREIAEDPDPEVKLYGTKLVPALATILGLSESMIYHIAASVDLLGAYTLRDLAADATKRGIKLTYSHIRELNRLSENDHADQINDILDRLLDGSILTHRQVKDEVDTILGTERVSISRPKVDDQAEEERALDQADAREGDALGELSTPGEIGKLCSQLVDLINSIDKKVGKVAEKIQAWRDDVSYETLEGMCMDSLDIASVAANDFAVKIKDVGLLLEETLRLASSVNSEV